MFEYISSEKSKRNDKENRSDNEIVIGDDNCLKYKGWGLFLRRMNHRKSEVMKPPKNSIRSPSAESPYSKLRALVGSPISQLPIGTRIM